MLYFNFLRVILLGAGFGLALAATAQQTSLNVLVLDENNQTMTGAHVWLEHTYHTAITGRNGIAVFELEPGSYQVKVRFLGYAEAEQRVLLTGEPETTVQLTMQPAAIGLDAVMVQSTRTGNASPIASYTMNKTEIRDHDQGRDIPYILQHLPSVVSSSDAGAGIGYTTMRVRGADMRSVNVTINGIPYNDAESQGVFWVNMPDFAGSLQSMQLQRGIGTSSHGSGAFGASLNMETNAIRTDPFAETSHTLGSFNTRRHNIQGGTGMLGNRFYFEGRLSMIGSDGYIERASSDLSSYFVQGAWISGRSMLKALVFGGSETTYQAWNGITPEQALENRRFNPAGAVYDASWNLTGYYDNQTDNYRQDHMQLHFSHRFNRGITGSIALHSTLGRGYYEEYRNDDRFSTYSMPPVITATDTLLRSDLIRQLWLDNHFYGAVFSLNQSRGLLRWTIGGGLNRYEGDHYGYVIWSAFNAGTPHDHQFYDNTGIKWDGNLFARTEWHLNAKWVLYADVQARMVDYRVEGVDRRIGPVNFSDDHFFVNPKAGVTFKPHSNHRLALFGGMVSREPARRDYIESPSGIDIQPEVMLNTEFNYQYHRNNFRWESNLFGMFYRNQLVLTGQISDTGAAIRDNSGRSFRVGIENSIVHRINRWVDWQANLTYMQSQHMDYTYRAPDDEWIHLDQSPISYSPELIANAAIRWMPVRGLRLALMPMYVSSQYLTNEGIEELKLDAYYQLDASVSYLVHPVGLRHAAGFRSAEVYVRLLNVTNNLYETYAYGYQYTAGNEIITEKFVFPQAGFHFLAGVNLRF